MKTIVLVCLLVIPLLALGDHPGMSPSIQEIKKQHAPRLLRLPGVVSVGVGRAHDGKKAIVVGLERPNPNTEAKIPTSLSGFPVRVQIIGPAKAQ